MVTGQTGQPVGGYRIPFNRPVMVGTEQAYLAEVLGSSRLAGDGEFGRRGEALLQDALGIHRVLLTTSCTHALELAALLLRLEPGDEVIVPSFTFVSTANAFVLRGARPVFVDIRPDTLNLDEEQLTQHFTARTKAIVPLHYAGIACEMDAIVALADRHEVEVVEDNAHGLFGSYHERPLGSFGSLATLSFHDTKNIICGEGGALLINDARYEEPAETIREKGTDRAQFFRGEVKRYTWREIGSSYLLSELLAAVLLAQLEARREIQGQRQLVWDRYRTELEGWAEEQGVQLPVVPTGCVPAYHLFHMLLPTTADRASLIEHLKQHGIQASWHYSPLHSSDMGQRLGADPRSCPVSEDVSSRLLRLPFYNDLSEPTQTEIIEVVSKWRTLSREI